MLLFKYISNKLGIDLKKAKDLQTNYFHKYNTSLNGLMIHHDINPEEFLKYVHDIDLSFMKKDLILREELKNLKLKKIDKKQFSYHLIDNPDYLKKFYSKATKLQTVHFTGGEPLIYATAHQEWLRGIENKNKIFHIIFIFYCFDLNRCTRFRSSSDRIVRIC